MTKAQRQSHKAANARRAAALIALRSLPKPRSKTSQRKRREELKASFAERVLGEPKSEGITCQ